MELSILVANLEMQGIPNSLYYLEGAKFIFSDRGYSSTTFSGSAYDVIIKLRKNMGRPPRYIFDYIVNAIREAASKGVVIFNVQIMHPALISNRHFTIHHDVASDDTIGINNCAFSYRKPIVHEDLRFRSKAEVAIYNELKTRNVLFFPNPAAVFGTTGIEYGERVKRREPDFLICLKGKWGILEINGDEFHSGITTVPFRLC